MSFPALPATYELGDRTKTQVAVDPTNRVYIYAVRRQNTRANGPSYYEVLRTKTGNYPPQPGRNLSGFTRLYDAQKRFQHWSIGASGLDLVTPITTGPAVTAKTSVHNGTTKGGSNAE